ncbi:SelT/SelW/SelH family protein [Haloplanus natans]|uniref:SelT/SelW/SelH family protein n=1 Tax=Haloplanus natans TaxID=376171 RepID=UPI000678072D|nr:Rdx family protein [Haloplanus natans]
MTDVEVEYCVPCGFLDRAETVQHALLTSLGEELDSVALVTGEKGVFRVSVDGETIYDKDEDGDYDADDLVRAVRDRMS